MNEKKEMKNIPSLKKPKKEINRIKDFIKKNVAKTAGNKAVIGLSGGIDSAVVTRISEEISGLTAIPVFMPESSTPERDCEDVNLLYEGKESDPKRLDIDSAVKEFKKGLPEMDRLSEANVKARVRMIYLYGISNIHEGMVVGTSNRSEWMIGYFTKYGDGAADISPIRHLYKTEIRELARRLDIPESIIQKPPSAGLWEDQTDRKELGGTYREIDQILYSYLELETPEDQLKEKWPARKALIDLVLDKISSQAHKRKGPPSLARS